MQDVLRLISGGRTFCCAQPSSTSSVFQSSYSIFIGIHSGKVKHLTLRYSSLLNVPSRASFRSVTMMIPRPLSTNDSTSPCPIWPAGNSSERLIAGPSSPDCSLSLNCVSSMADFSNDSIGGIKIGVKTSLFVFYAGLMKNRVLKINHNRNRRFILVPSDLGGCLFA